MNREDLQRYIDRELDASTQKKWSHHFENCATCRNALRDSKKETESLLEAFSSLDLKPAEAPPFNHFDPNRQKKNRLPLLGKIAAALIVLLGVASIITSVLDKSDKVIEPSTTTTAMARDVDPNSLWHNSEMVVTITDRDNQLVMSMSLD